VTADRIGTEREHWFCSTGDPSVLKEMRDGALRAIERTGKRQVVHVHAAGERCDDTACWVIEHGTRAS
jgi:hypothetical protein